MIKTMATARSRVLIRESGSRHLANVGDPGRSGRELVHNTVLSDYVLIYRDAGLFDGLC
jgi:hypothetical protein